MTSSEESIVSRSSAHHSLIFRARKTFIAMMAAAFCLASSCIYVDYANQQEAKKKCEADRDLAEAACLATFLQNVNGGQTDFLICNALKPKCGGGSGSDDSDTDSSSALSALAQARDTNPPIPGGYYRYGDAVLDLTSSSDSIRVEWWGAMDEETSITTHRYEVYYSTVNNISNVQLAEQNGTLAATGSVILGGPDRYDYTIRGLNSTTRYYIQVLVVDGNGNKAAYQMSYIDTK